jgi:hypothetical protein
MSESRQSLFGAPVFLIPTEVQWGSLAPSGENPVPGYSKDAPQNRNRTRDLDVSTALPDSCFRWAAHDLD